MKKLLCAALVLAMGVACAGALTACGGDNSSESGINEAEVAKKAITQIRGLYADKEETTPVDYTVMGQVKVDTTICVVNWSVSSETTENLSDYITVGEMDASTKLVTISVAQSADVIEYQLTASVTVGESTQTTSFNRKTVAPLTVAEAEEITKGLGNGEYYKAEGSNEATLVYVKGYIIDPGTWSTQYNNYSNIYIADNADAKKADAFLVYRVVKDSKFITQDGDLTKGDLAVFGGYLQNYYNESKNTNTYELTYNGSNNVTCVSLTKVQRTDAEKVAAAKEAVDLSTKYFVETKSVQLPATNNGANLSWRIKGETDLVTIADGALNIVKLPETETKVTLTLTITCGEETDTKDIEITITKPLELDHKGTTEDPYSVKDVKEIGKTLAAGDYYTKEGVRERFCAKGYVIDAGEWSSDYNNYSYVYIADTADAAKADALQIYRIVTDEQFVKGEGDLKVGDCITVSGFLQNYQSSSGKITLQITNNGKTETVTVVAMEKAPDTRTDAEKVADALKAVTLNTTYTEAGEAFLPETTVEGVVLSWASSNTDLVTVADNKLTIVSIPEIATEVTITVTAMLNDVTENKTITVKLMKALELEGAGTQESPYTVADAKAIASTLDGTKNEYYQENGTDVIVCIKGYVINAGSWNPQYNNLNKVIIADKADATEAEGLLIYRIVTDDTFMTKEGDLKVGDIVTFSGVIQNYGGTYELTYHGKNSVMVVALEKAPDTRADAEKVADALKAAVLKNTTYTEEGEETLPASTVEGVTLEWTVSANDFVTIANGKLTVAEFTASGEVTVTVTAKLNDVTDFKEITIKLVKDLGLEHVGTEADPYTAADVNKIFATLATGETYKENGVEKEIYVKGYVTDVGTVGNYGLQNVYIADVEGAAKNASVLVYSINWNDVFAKGDVLRLNDVITVKGYLKDYNGTKEVAQSTEKVYPVITVIERAPRTNEQQIADALDKVAATLANITEVGDVVLPVSSEENVTFVWTIKDGTAATIVDGKLHVEALPETDSEMTLVVTAKCGEADDAKEVKVTIKAAPKGDSTVVSTTIVEYATKNSWVNATKYDTVNLDDKITVKATGKDNTGKYYTKGNEWRTYQSENPQIVFTAVAGYRISSVKITYTPNNNGVLIDANGTQYASGTEIKVNANNITFSVGNTGTATNGQVKITAIEVTYVAE